ncbi:hypothetical protein N7478_002798 [Penicillium angulare]|uniref:uncharacterized protein n=1 Tax=Penicillium angulare TaxID=116970 RepID=UPI00253F89EA|nr:uncharacterized protein N7478_002798 [Penicillium angulare]KAJ5287112.1 hypothetical protein N7478_002798 [Penicillium angulare]
MSENIYTNDAAQATQGSSSWFSRKLSKKLSHNSSRENTPKETTSSQGGIGQQALDKGEEIKKDVTSGNFGSVKDATGKGENVKNAINQGDTAEAFKETGWNKDNVNEQNIDEVGNRLFGSFSSPGVFGPNDDIKKGPITEGNDGGVDQRDTGQELVGATGSGSGSGAAQESGPKTASTGAGLLGITTAGTGASKSGSTSNTQKPGTGTPETKSTEESLRQKLDGKSNVAGGTFGENSMNQELDDQAHISSSVFGDRNGLQNTSKDVDAHGPTTPGIDQKLSERRKLSTGKIDHSKSKSSQQGGAMRQGAIGGAALGAAGGMGKGGTSQQATTSGQTAKGMTTQGRMSGVTGGGLTQAVGQKGAAKGARPQGGIRQGALAGGALGAGALGAGALGAGALGAGNTRNATSQSQKNEMASLTPRAVTNLSGPGYKVTVLQEKVQAVSQKCKTQLGGSASEISLRSPTVDAFFDAVAAERLRWMPRDGSRLDCSLRWASRLAYAVDNLRESIGAFAPGANEAAKLIWGFEIMLLESDIDNTEVFESIFGRYGRLAVGIRLLLQYESVYQMSAELRAEATAVFADLLEMICSTTTSCVEGFKAKESDRVIGHNVDAAFVTYAKRFSTHWNAIVEFATWNVVQQSSLVYSSPELGSLRQFLGVQDRPLQFILDSRSHSLAEGSFEWFNNALYDFTVGKIPVMMVNGGAGSGKSAMAQWTVDRMQESSEHEGWNVIPYTIRADIPVATLPLRILKGILHQMLDHCVIEKGIQEDILFYVAKAAQSALDGGGEAEVEDSLWKGIRTGLESDIQYMFVVDGLDQIKGGEEDATAFMDKFSDVLSQQNEGSKMIVFTRPLKSKMSSQIIQQFTMQSSQTKADMQAYVHKSLSSGFSSESVKSAQLETAVSTIVNRSQGSFSWAALAVENAKQQRTLSEAIQSVQGLPQSMSELIDFHMKHLDLSQNETKYIMSWLAAAERPLLMEEIEQLLVVDPESSSFVSRPSNLDDGWSKALSPVVMTRDGVVSFAHTCIREHVIKQARISSAKAPLNLKEAHYDLLLRCLAWVQLSVREETEISMDKLGMEERNRLFDKYVILEYTGRYWLSHLLSSPLVTDDGEFSFNESFRNLVPITVLFARLELTCRESQFTRSSVVELYRLATDIRRLVLGDKSMALLQSLLLSARVSKYAHAGHADEHCYEAWRLSQELLGQSDAITLTCADIMTQSFAEQETMTSQQEDIMKYLILTDSEITGVEFNQRLKYLGMIVGMYKYRDDNSSALKISKQFYQQILQKYGTNSRQSSDTADFLTSQFSSTGNDAMSRDIARTKYDNVVNTMEVTDERRIKYTLYMAQLYEQQGEIAQAQGVLSNLWAGLNSRDIDSVDMMNKKANVALVYYQFLRHQGRSDEAEVIIRELVADLEVTGVHSEAMMQRVQLLRAETRKMHMYSLDRSLAVLMWRFYKENNLEYSSEATTLALSLAEELANTVSIEESTSFSGRDRKLMVELLDSITSSSSNLSVSTLILCHNLASIYVHEDDWVEASDCSKAVLQHVWPNVEQAGGSHKKFTTELAPPIADLALVLAYCHFRRLHLEQATIVYENAFGSLISSDRVPVPSVLAVAKAVVEFYETTFQFTKALTLLHSVSNFLTVRLGETHKHTIENLYLEAALANRLEMSHEAKSTYQRIYKATTREGKIAPEGFEAAIALVALYERELQWDAALDVYRHLWPTLVIEDSMNTYDRIMVERMLEKTYMGYMSILTTRTKTTDFSERYKVSSEYVTTCRNVYGATNQKTLSATLLFAELCETSDLYTDQAITLYKMPLQTPEWVPTSQSSKGLDQMTAPLPITLKHKLAQLFVRKRDSTSEARSLYTEEFQLGKKTKGFFSNTTLSWLRELALAHSRQGTPTSVQQGNALLHTYITDVLHNGGESEAMMDWARKIASIYLECGFIDGGNSVLDELRQRVVYGSETSARALGDRRDAIFVAAFEEAFGRRATYSQIMTEMACEMQTHQAFTKNLSGHDFIPTLVSGNRLALLQTGQKRTRAAKDTRSKLYEYFCATLSATSITDREIVKQFYAICLREVHGENYNMAILTTTTGLVHDLCNSGRFRDASDVTGVLHSFLHLTDGLNSYESIITATKLCLYLSGHQATRCENEKLFSEMSVKSKLLLQELLASSKSIGIQIVDLPFHELNDIITLLGEYEMFDDLEEILTQLWTSRIVQRTWTPDVVVWIGRRLVETRFCRGAIDSSIQLCRDICYNLRQVWGSYDNVTLEMTKLLSGLFTASGDHASAATLHEGILHDLMNDSDAKSHPGAADTASQHVELLRRSQSRLGTSKQSTVRQSAHAEIVAQITEKFGLKSGQLKGVGEANGGDSFGVWSKPRRFSIDVEDLEDEGQMHHNHLRESSGAGMMSASGTRRISVQAL